MPHSPLESRLLKALMEAETTIRQLEQDNTRINAQLAEKTLICQQLLNEKQEHVLHMARCSSGDLFQQLEKAKSQVATLQLQVQQMSERYESQHKSERQEIKKLVSYNRALRVENNALREKVSRSSTGSRKIGAITTLGNP
jgi:siroheme synthase